MKDKWYNYIITNKNLWGNGWTLKRLDKVKNAVLIDEDIMFDLLQRHNGENIEPEQMKETDKSTYDHCIGNFVCNIHYKMMDLKLIKD
jgi:hypothetical protein